MNTTLSWLVSAWFVFEIIVRIAAFFVVPRNRKPSSATAWLLLIMLFPTIGLLTFLLIGSPKLSKPRRAAQAFMDTVIDETVDTAKKNPHLAPFFDAPVPQHYLQFSRLNTTLSRLPTIGGNNIELLTEYDETLDRIAADIDSAKEVVHIEFFILVMDEATEPIFKAMERAAARGLTVRVLFDAIGVRRYPRFKEMCDRLDTAGILWSPMLPLRPPGKSYTRPDLRNHRKLVAIDARIGYTGSLNLVTRNYHRKDRLIYDELMARIEGPIVSQLHGVFITDWYMERSELLGDELAGQVKNITRAGNVLAQVLPSGPGYEFENNLKLFNSLIYAARERIIITNPYFVPDESLLAAIITAAQRGVEVILINSEIMDQRMVGHAQRSFYEELLTAGVKIYWYKWPVLLHSKHITIDDEVTVIGSSNFDIRSFELNLEISLIVYGPAVTKKLHAIENMYIGRSKQLTLRSWKNRSLRLKLLDNIARLTAALQ